MDRHSIYCITENGWVDKYSSTQLTTCPNNATHDVNPDSWFIKDELQGTSVSFGRTMNVKSLFYTLTYTYTTRNPLSFLRVNTSSSSMYINIWDDTDKKQINEKLVAPGITTIDCLVPYIDHVLMINTKMVGVVGGIINEIILIS